MSTHQSSNPTERQPLSHGATQQPVQADQVLDAAPAEANALPLMQSEAFQRLHQPQQHAAFRQVQRMHGNQHAQRIVADAAKDTPQASDPSPIGTAIVKVPLARVFTEPSTSAIQLTVLQRQSMLEVLAQQGKWLKIKYHTSFLNSAFIQADNVVFTPKQTQATSKDGTRVIDQANSLGERAARLIEDKAVERVIEQFLHEFSNIPVTVKWNEGGQERSEVIPVHPPYFINTRDFPDSKKRLEAAHANRKHASSNIKTEFEGNPGNGKGTLTEIQAILQKAVDSNLVKSRDHKSHPDAEDLRAWLKTYGIGVDCSAFVAQALDRIGERMPGHPLTGKSKFNLDLTGSGSLKGGQPNFDKVTKPADLRPGDTMHISNHIRIVMSVKDNGSGGIEFTTAESSPSHEDIGPMQATWQYPKADLMKNLEEKVGEDWSPYNKIVTYGRYTRSKQSQKTGK